MPRLSAQYAKKASAYCAGGNKAVCISAKACFSRKKSEFFMKKVE